MKRRFNELSVGSKFILHPVVQDPKAGLRRYAVFRKVFWGWAVNLRTHKLQKFRNYEVLEVE